MQDLFTVIRSVCETDEEKANAEVFIEKLSGMLFDNVYDWIFNTSLSGPDDALENINRFAGIWDRAYDVVKAQMVKKEV